MRRGDIDQVVDALDAPTRRFVREARVRLALLVNRSGQVLAQHGFTRQYEVIEVAALAAAAHAAANALADLTGTRRWTHLHHAGRDREMVVAPLDTPAEPLIVVAVFERDSSLGLVRLFVDRLAEEIEKLPELNVTLPAGPDEAESFERDLEAGLRHLFGTPEPEAERRM